MNKMYVLRASVLANEEVFQLLGSFSVLKNRLVLFDFLFCFVLLEVEFYCRHVQAAPPHTKTGKHERQR